MTLVPAAPESVPVLIIGAGPAGLTAGLLLARLGIDSIIVDRRSQPSLLPRATGVNVRSMEVYRTLGLEGRIDAASMRTEGVPFLLVGETLASSPRATIESTQYTPPADVGWPSPTYARWCAQDDLDAVLLEALRDEPRCDVQFGTEMVSLEVGPGAGIRAVVRHVATGTTRTVTAEYALGADGARSHVRECLGIAMHGQAGLPNQLNILFSADFEAHLGGRQFCLYRIENDSVSGVLRPAGRSGRWLFGTAGATGTTPDRCTELVRAAVGVPDLQVHIVAIGGWEPAARVAGAFRVGPVFLVGDSAHQHTPGGGFGMNAAIAAAHNLAWKVAAVLNGWAGPGLLDSYQIERRPLALLTTALSIKLLEAGGLQSAQTLGVVLGAHYDAGALTPDATLAPAVDDPIIDYVPAALPGHRAPHVWLDRGQNRSTLDWFGSGLVVCTPDPAMWQAAVKQAASTGVPIRVGLLPSDAAAVYGLGPVGAVLVRPDGHVAARWGSGADHPETQLAKALDTVLQR